MYILPYTRYKYIYTHPHTDVKLWLWEPNKRPICFFHGLPLNLVLHIFAALNLLLML